VISLRDMTPAEVAVAVPRVFEGYIEDRVEAGQDRDEARVQAESQHATLFPGGVPAEGQHLMHVLDDEDVIGLLWMGRPLTSSATMWFVYFVEIDEAHRGRGLGRVAMECAERWTREHGGSRIGLNVFGPNVVARRLYDSLGYRVMATTMFKDLGA
jgi:GNAT superfamily N-acetyltransferase